MNTLTMLKSTRGALVATAFATAGFIAIPANAETYYLTGSGSITQENVWTNSTGEAATLLDDIAAADHADDWFIIDEPYYGRVVNTNGTDNGNSQDHYFNAHIGFQGWSRLFFYGQSLDGCTLHLNGNSYLFFYGPDSDPSEMPSIKSNASIIVEGGASSNYIKTWRAKSWVHNLGVELKCPISGSGPLCLTYDQDIKMVPIVLNPQTEGGNSNFTGSLRIKGADADHKQVVEVKTSDALGGELDAGAPGDYGLALDYAKLIVSADVTTSANRVLYIPNDSEICVDEGKTLTALGKRRLLNGKMLTKTGKGMLYLKGGILNGWGNITVEEGTLAVGCSGGSDVNNVNVKSNATMLVAESGVKLVGHVNLYGGTLKIADNVSVVSNGTGAANADRGIAIYPLETSSLVIGENVNLDIRVIEVFDGAVLNINAPTNSHVRLLHYVYNPEKAKEADWRLAHITYNGHMITMGENCSIEQIDSDTYFDVGDEVDLKYGSVTLDSVQAMWLNLCINRGSVKTKDGVKDAAKNLTRDEFDEACLLNIDIADSDRRYAFGVTRFEILRNYEDEENALGDYAKIYVTLERSEPVGNQANGRVKIYASSSLENLEESPTDGKLWLANAEGDESGTNWKIKESRVFYPLAVEGDEEPPAFFKVKLVPQEFE